MLSNGRARKVLKCFNPTYKGHADKLAAEIQLCDISAAASPTEQFLGVAGTYFEGLAPELPPVIPEKQRAKNARTVNLAQLRWLRENKMLKDPLDATASVSALKESNRTLVPYFRSPGKGGHGDVDPFEFGVSVYAIERLIRERRTRIFNNVCCVSRFANKFPGYLLDIYSPDIYDPSTEDAFIIRTAIASNIIHYTHGDPSEQIKLGSLPLLGAAMRKDWFCMDWVSDRFVPLRLDYDERNSRIHTDKLWEKDFSGSVKEVIAETLRGMQRLEEKMLQTCASQAGVQPLWGSYNVAATSRRRNADR